MKFPHLVQGLGILRHRDEGEAEHLLKCLREGGSLPPSKRGFGAADVTPQDASVILLALMFDIPATKLSRAIQVLQSLKPRRVGGIGQAYFGPVGKSASAETFGDALTVLIAEAPILKAMAMDFLLLAFGRDPMACIEDLFSLSLTVQLRPAPYARLVLSTTTERGVRKDEFICEWTADSELLAAGFYAPELRERGDLTTESTITHKTIFRFGDLLAADSTEENGHAESSRVEGDPQPEGRGNARSAQKAEAEKRDLSDGESQVFEIYES